METWRALEVGVSPEELRVPLSGIRETWRAFDSGVSPEKLPRPLSGIHGDLEGP